MSYIDVTAKNEEEAVAKALAQLSLDRDDVSVQILERAKTGFLGLGSAPAKVRVTYEGYEAPKVLVEEVKPEPKP
ncbi:MAG: Jag N-terminal domain-containing protein, partial [Oscillospiraceae bacterium]